MWLGGVMVTASDLCSTGRGFDSQPFHYQVATLGKLFTHCASVTKQYNLVPAKGRWCPAAGKVTVGLASHWPCVTDFSGLSTYGLKGYEREMSTPPTSRRGMVNFTFTLMSCSWLALRCMKYVSVHDCVLVCSKLLVICFVNCTRVLYVSTRNEALTRLCEIWLIIILSLAVYG